MREHLFGFLQENKQACAWIPGESWSSSQLLVEPPSSSCLGILKEKYLVRGFSLHHDPDGSKIFSASNNENEVISNPIAAQIKSVSQNNILEKSMVSWKWWKGKKTNLK